MTKALKPMLAALFCVLALLLCGVMTHPVAEIGMVDDWSYIESARVLSQTGHFVLNGWAAPMLGWQLLLGALFMKLFGATYTVARASIFLVSLVTAFLVHRTLVRAGVNTWNATLGTLTLALCPLFLTLALSFMSDMGGIFCIALCLYACVHALQGESDRAVLGWLVFAAISNDLAGTVRQIGWLGVLVMFPCTVWLLRKRPRVVPVGAALYLLSGVFIFGAMHWFQGQPYSVAELSAPLEATWRHPLLIHLFSQLVKSLFLTIPMFLLPILVGFAFAPSLRTRRNARFLGIGVLFFAAIGLALQYRHQLPTWVLPNLQTHFTEHGFDDWAPIRGTRPVVVPYGVQFVLTAVVVLLNLCFLGIAIPGRDSHAAPFESTVKRLPWRTLLVLTGPFTAAYLVLLAHRTYTSLLGIMDRYLVPLMLIALLLLLKLFQERVRPKLPLVSVVVLLLLAGFTVAGTHDVFTMYRARLEGINEMRDAGIPRASIDGGFEYNGMTQIEIKGHINDPGIRFPSNAYVPAHRSDPPNCPLFVGDKIPVVEPLYALSFNPNACAGQSRFQPVVYHAWLGPHAVTIYIVNTGKSAAAGTANGAGN